MRREHHLSDAAQGFTAKFAPKFAGPYRVAKFLEPNLVVLKGGNNCSSRAHVKDLKPCTEDNINSESPARGQPDDPETISTRARTRAQIHHSRIMDDVLLVDAQPELESHRLRQRLRELFGDSSD